MGKMIIFLWNGVIYLSYYFLIKMELEKNDFCYEKMWWIGFVGMLVVLGMLWATDVEDYDLEMGI
jgi:hypothetical protein